MAFPKCRDKENFRKNFLEKIMKEASYGAFISDEKLKEFIKENNIKANFDKVMSFIRELEYEIGMTFKKRLRRMRNEGYLVLESHQQAKVAILEGKAKVNRALKTTSRRLDAVNIEDWTREQQQELMSRTQAVNSLLTIIENSSLNKNQVSQDEVVLLEHTARESRNIKKRKA